MIDSGGSPVLEEKAMGEIFLAVGIGFFIGFKGVLKEKGVQLNAKMQTVWLMLLIFCMGVSIGRNGDIVKNLPALGGKAVLFSVTAIIGSVIVVYILSTLFLQKEGNQK